MLKKALSKKSILLVMNNLDGSGIKTSFLNLLSYLDVLDYEVDVLIFKDDLNSKKILNNFKVNILSSNLILRAVSFNMSEFKFDIVNSISFIIFKILFAFFNKKFIFVFFLKLFRVKLTKNYDYSISFVNDIWKHDKLLHYNGSNDFVINSSTSRNKVSWIHNDPNKLGINMRVIKNEYTKFSHIVNVSKYCEKVFLSFKVISKRNSFVIYNFLNQTFHAPINIKVLNPQKICFISSSRLEIKQKRIDRVINVSKMLIENGYRNFDWIVLGSGKLINKFRKDVDLYNLSKNVHFIGKVNNPLHYYNNSDFFIQTSDYEANSLSLLEAKYSRLSLIVMNYNGASEVVGKNEGTLVDFLDGELYKTLASVLDNPNYYRNYFFKGDYNEVKKRNLLNINLFLK